jgi:hypothetical protein
MRNDQEERKRSINNDELDTPRINRGVELILRNQKRREPPKTFQIKFGKMVSFFKREFHFFLDFHFDIRKKED